MNKAYIQDTIIHLKKEGNPPPANLDYLEYATMKSYSFFSDEFNGYLRDADQKNDEFDYSSNVLNRAIGKLPKYIQEENSLFRGVQLPPVVFDQIQKTNKYVENGFFSTSLSLEKAERFMAMDMKPESILCVFEIIDSSIGINFSQYVGLNEIDGVEILFPTKVEFDIVNIKKDTIEFLEGAKEMFRIKIRPII